MGDMMHRSNIGMTRAAMDALKDLPKSRVLELGPGNGSHVQELLNRFLGAVYSGLDISETMYTEALEINAPAIRQGKASFSLYDGQHIPFPDQRFEQIFSVNTLYFWQEPVQLLQELQRVLVPQGQLVVVFVHKETMEQLPFVGAGFTLYNNDSFSELIQKSPFTIAALKPAQDEVVDKSGEHRVHRVHRKYTVAVLEG